MTTMVQSASSAWIMFLVTCVLSVAMARKQYKYDASAHDHDSDIHPSPYKGLHLHGIGKYQLFTFDTNTLLDRHEEHHRSRREIGRATSAQSAIPLAISLQAHDRALELRMHSAEDEIFHKNFQAIATSSGPNGSQVVDIDTSVFYHGHVLDEHGSAISAYIDRGRLVGSIVTRDEHYFIERADKYLGDTHFTNIIYKGSDIVENKTNFEGMHYSNMIEKQREYETNMEGTTPYHKRHRRADYDASLNTCGTYLIGDNTFYASFSGSDAEQQAISEMISHLDAASLIYRITEFDMQDGLGARSGVVQLAVKKVEVLTDSGNKLGGFFTCSTSGCLSSQECSQPYLDALSSGDNYDEYCLVHAFCRRDFCGGILGLAWVGAAGGSSGMCGKFGGDPAKSLNTGISTTINFAVSVSKQVQTITLAHEFGHNFGSSHDVTNGQSSSGQACAPGGGAGNYIMYLKATDGDAANNNKFSACSIEKIQSVIEARSADCFESKSSETCGNSLLVQGTCGNGILELDEECECGSTVDPCCKCDGPEEGRCKAVGECSPITDPYCCNSDCTLKGLPLDITLERYKEALNESLISGDTSISNINSKLNSKLSEKCPSDVTDTDGCELQRFCIKDPMYSKYKGQQSGSCPQLDHIVTLANGDASAQDWANDPNRSACYAFQSVENPSAPDASDVLSCLGVIDEWNNGGTQQTSDCYLFRQIETAECNNGQSLCAYNGCSGSICASYVREDDPTEKATKCRLGEGDQACDVSCVFASDGVNEICTSLKQFATVYPNSNQKSKVANYVAGASQGNLGNGKACFKDGDPYGGMCESGNCKSVKNDLGTSITISEVGDWLKNNYQYVLIFIAVVIIVVIALRCTYRRNKGLIDKLNKRKQRNAENERRRRKMGQANGMPLTSAMRADMRARQNKELQLLRLKEFFPLAQEKKLIHFQKISNSEQEMVKRLLKEKEVLHVPVAPPLLAD